MQALRWLETNQNPSRGRNPYKLYERVLCTLAAPICVILKALKWLKENKPHLKTSEGHEKHNYPKPIPLWAAGSSFEILRGVALFVFGLRPFTQFYFLCTDSQGG